MHGLKVIYTIFNTTLTFGLFAFREVGAVVVLFVIVALGLDHSEKKHVLLVTGLEAQLSFKFMWLGGARPAHKHVMVAAIRYEAERFDLPALAIDSHGRS